MTLDRAPWKALAKEVNVEHDTRHAPHATITAGVQLSTDSPGHEPRLAQNPLHLPTTRGSPD